MKVAGIVAEYNLFHNGHKYQIDTLKDQGYTHVVTAMSGNFVQRGDAAIIDKWARTKMALLGGVDLVVEIPTCYCLAPAQKFSFGAVSVLNSLNIVDNLAFGSESADLSNLQKCVIAIEDTNVNLKIKEYLKSGVTFAVARERAVNDCFGETVSNMLKTPNDILATEYISALKSLNSKIKPVAIKRTGVGHDDFDTCDNIASASKIRELILNNQDFSHFVPQNVYDIFMDAKKEGFAPFKLENAQKAILWQLRQMSNDDFERLCDVSEGFHNRLYNVAIQRAGSLEELLELAKTKRYTMARIKRLVLNATLSIYEYKLPPYIRVLGFSENGKELLKQLKQKCTLPLVSSYSDACKVSETAKQYFINESKYTDFHSLLCPVCFEKNREFTQSVESICININ